MPQEVQTAILLVIVAAAVIVGGFLTAWLLCRWVSERRERRREKAMDTITMRIANIQRERHLTTVTGLIPVIRDTEAPGGKSATPERGLLTGFQPARRGKAA